MRVQLSEKSKADFIELITKDSITCWFEGDEFVIPSGQGKTAKGIVLGKLLVWQYRQTEVDALKLQVAEMKSRLNDAYTDGQSAMYAARQTKVDELQKRVDAALKMISINRGFAWGSVSISQLEQALKGEHA